MADNDPEPMPRKRPKKGSDSSIREQIAARRQSERRERQRVSDETAASRASRPDTTGPHDEEDAYSFSGDKTHVTGQKGTGQSELAPGSRVGRFVLREFLARGGMGQVWVATDTNLQREVALKLILPELINEQSLGMFQREARAGARASHPNIVATHASGTDDGLTWISQELVRGSRTLKDFLEEARSRERTPRSYYREVAELVVSLADGLDAAHRAGVIHRDLKPANILITEDQVPKITDFGLARVKDDSYLSVTGQVAGTWAYMSPEQITTKRLGIDHRTDVFSLGIVLYELLTQRRPFDGDTTAQLAEKIMHHDAQPVRSVRSRCPVELSVICGKAMEKRPEDRYQTAAELAADLRRHLADEPILAKPPGPLAKGVKWVRRHPVVGSTVAVGLVALLVVSGFKIANTRLAKNSAEQARIAEAKAREAARSAERARAAEAERERAEEERKLAEARRLEAAEALKLAEAKRKRAEEERKRAEARRLEAAEALKLAEAGRKRASEERARDERKRALDALKLGDSLRLSAQQDIASLHEGQAALWPPYPERLDAYRAWIRKAEELIADLPLHESRAEKLRSLTRARSEEPRPAHPLLTKSERESQELRSHPPYEGRRALEVELAAKRRALAVRLGDATVELVPVDPWKDIGPYPQSMGMTIWRLVKPDRTSFGYEARGLALATSVLKMVGDDQRAMILDLLAWGRFALGDDDGALVASRAALAAAGDACAEDFQGYLEELTAAVDAARSKEGLVAATREIATLESRISDFDDTVNERVEWIFPDAEESARSWHDQMLQLIEDLRTLRDDLVAADVATARFGWSVGKRLAFAESLAAGFAEGGEHSKAWAAALPEIRASHPSLAELTPQMGLLPIGIDPESGLWEFAHLATGDRATRAEDGKLILTVETGLVMVLIPGGTFVMGAQSSDKDGPNYDPEPLASTGAPPHEVTLSPYFISKFEMTQGQWLRAAGSNPSAWNWKELRANSNRDHPRHKLLHPVERVTWTDCTETCMRIGLVLPTEAQWENACRAGTTSAYWCGSNDESLRGVENVYWKGTGPKNSFDVGWGHAQVGTFLANAFGLHDVHGNVQEWCADGYSVEAYHRKGAIDPLVDMSTDLLPVYRGGSFQSHEPYLRFAHSAFRHTGRLAGTSEWQGLRPARSVVP